VQRYRSDKDNDCWPLPYPPNSDTAVWVLGQGSPIVRFTGDVHQFSLDVPKQRLVTDARATQVQIWIQTGGDDLRGGSNPGDNATVSLRFAGGAIGTGNIQRGAELGERRDPPRDPQSSQGSSARLGHRGRDHQHAVRRRHRRRQLERRQGRADRLVPPMTARPGRRGRASSTTGWTCRADR